MRSERSLTLQEAAVRRLFALVVALAVVAMTAAGAIAWAVHDDGSTVRMGPGSMGPGMMGPGSMGPGMWGPGSMGMVAASSEPEFLVEMIAHHQEAVAAAGELDRSGRAEMRAFGESIVTSQSAQIEQMQAWLRQWYPDESTASDYRPMMRDLSGLTGDELDEAFLEDMIGHHMTAVMMSQHLLVRNEVAHDEVAVLARTIRDDQRAEIFGMRRWLAEWFPS